ncbi:response regulator [Tessaracoccus sp. HDW20]|uniref:response regulator n=1 Tax=Tessaracoccus coleopterorum TaxID=2714950 RepID=UPI0018D45FD6|nr:response regulator [Tessaracoccus coleopterorum]NHB86122.1 response regulator [Tessaracoccus coleopterorum]
MSGELILLVEDDADLRELVSLTLSSAGYRAITAPDGDAALAQFHAQSPDLVLLDISLGPDSIDGLEVCRRIRRSSEAPWCSSRATETTSMRSSGSRPGPTTT